MPRIAAQSNSAVVLALRPVRDLKVATPPIARLSQNHLAQKSALCITAAAFF